MASNKGKRKAAEAFPEPDAAPRLQRAIILLDMDNFYVACERARDPSLVGKPIGIRQKQILATCSYEARELGVTKLCLTRDALKLCPQLVIVPGEDLTHYRAFSRQIFALVRSILGDDTPVEKLGMDEMFCDVSLVVAKQADGLRARSDDGSRVWWGLSRSDPPDPMNNPPLPSEGFWYDPNAIPGNVEPPFGSFLPCSPLKNDPLCLASHLARHLRSSISAELGFPASAGIGPSKLIAKLLSECHKPEGQTTWNPYQPTSESDWVADVQVGKVQGFGFQMVSRLKEELSPYEGPWTLRATREHPRVSPESLSDWYGPTAGRHLWGLLHGRDDSPVVGSSEWPNQVGVEDSYGSRRGSLAWTTWRHEVQRVAALLVRRLDGELRASPGGCWRRWPEKLRLTVLLRGAGGRVSRTTRLPIEVFEDREVELRAEELVRAVSGLWKAVCGGKAEGNLHIINLTATDLATTAPSRGVRSLFGLHGVASSMLASSARALPRAEEQGVGWEGGSSIDYSVLLQLPDDLRRQLMQQHGITEVELLSRAERAEELVHPLTDRYSGDGVSGAVEDVEWPDEDGDSDAASVSDGLAEPWLP